MATVFYRAQSDQSLTIFKRGEGFDTHHYYHGPFALWLGRRVFAVHLSCHHPPVHKPTPFISVFDNADDAEARARHLVRTGHTGVFVAKIEVPRPIWGTMRIRYRSPKRQVDLHMLMETPEQHSTWFISTKDARQYLGLNVHGSRLSEWCAMNYIPDHLITGYRYFK